MSEDKKELVMYTRTSPCPFVTLAKRVLNHQHVTYRELFIDQDKAIERRVLTWTGFLSVPTLIIAREGEDLPYEEPSPLPKDSSPRGVNRGPMLTEPSEEQLLNWLRQHGLLNGNQ
jgi:glutaredoxin